MHLFIQQNSDGDFNQEDDEVHTNNIRKVSFAACLLKHFKVYIQAEQVNYFGFSSNIHLEVIHVEL